MEYYTVLGVERTASADQVRAAYRARARLLHPDKHTGSAQAEASRAFQQLEEAYSVLSDPARRREYDRSTAGGSGSSRRRVDDYTPGMDPVENVESMVFHYAATVAGTADLLDVDLWAAVAGRAGSEAGERMEALREYFPREEDLVNATAAECFAGSVNHLTRTVGPAGAGFGPVRECQHYSNELWEHFLSGFTASQKRSVERVTMTQQSERPPGPKQPPKQAPPRSGSVPPPKRKPAEPPPEPVEPGETGYWSQPVPKGEVVWLFVFFFLFVAGKMLYAYLTT